MKIGLLFSGQGAQHVGMGKDVVEAYPETAALFQQADAVLQNGFSDVCFNGPAERLTDTSYCQPALFTHGLALLAALQKERPGFQFHACAGLSLGEFTAHTAAGHFHFTDGLKLVAERGRLMQEACLQTKGGMISLIGASPGQAQELAAAVGLEVANYNCPGQIVLSGPLDLIPLAMAKGKELGLKRALPLNVAGAYHSVLMQSAQAGLKPHIDAVPIQTSSVAVYANVTGKQVKAPEEIRDTLLRQVTGSVRWEQCVEELITDGATLLIEIGPGKVLTGMCKRIHKEMPCLSIGNVEDLKGALHEIK